MVPVRLALLKLHLHRLWKEQIKPYIMGELEQLELAGSHRAKTASPSPATQQPSSLQPTQAAPAKSSMDVESGAPPNTASPSAQVKDSADGSPARVGASARVYAIAAFRWADTMVHTHVGTWEDLLLVLLCGALAIVVYIRARVQL